jgi:hypothetical protein
MSFTLLFCVAEEAKKVGSFEDVRDLKENVNTY